MTTTSTFRLCIVSYQIYQIKLTTTCVDARAVQFSFPLKRCAVAKTEISLPKQQYNKRRTNFLLRQRRIPTIRRTLSIDFNLQYNCVESIVKSFVQTDGIRQRHYARTSNKYALIKWCAHVRLQH